MRAWWWRAIYALIGSRLAVASAAGFLSVVSALRGRSAAAHLIGVFEQRFVYSGWPLYAGGWTNLHMSKAATALRRRGRPLSAKRAPVADAPSKIVVVGRFVGLLGFPKELLDACPAKLAVADIGHQGGFAAYLERPGREYEAFDLDGGTASAADVARFINRAAADLVINVGHKQEAFDILDLVDAPCIANYCAGSDLLHHAKVDIQYHGQPEADYFVVDGRMFCGTTRNFLPSSYIHTITGYIDPRGLLSRASRPWADREPLIVCHGSLFKFAAPAFRDVLMQVLARNPATKLVLMGRDDGRSLTALQASAARAGVGDRVVYAGVFSAVRGIDGDLSDPGWHQLLDLLGRARLAPDAFPLGGGSSRFEAYATGVPSVHLGVNFDEPAWGRPQPGTCEIPSLAASLGTARSIAEYEALCDRALVDGAFADALIDQQLQLARNVGNAERWWQEILDGHARWRASERRAA